jgi:transcriptional regulator with XRE-family HTH domain
MAQTTDSDEVYSPHVRIDSAKLQRKRHLLGLTQAALAERAGISPGYLGHLERGIRENVRPPTFVKICDALEIDEEDRDVLRAGGS